MICDRSVVLGRAQAVGRPVAAFRRRSGRLPSGRVVPSRYRARHPDRAATSGELAPRSRPRKPEQLPSALFRTTAPSTSASPRRGMWLTSKMGLVDRRETGRASPSHRSVPPRGSPPATRWPPAAGPRGAHIGGEDQRAVGRRRGLFFHEGVLEVEGSVKGGAVRGGGGPIAPAMDGRSAWVAIRRLTMWYERDAHQVGIEASPHGSGGVHPRLLMGRGNRAPRGTLDEGGRGAQRADAKTSMLGSGEGRPPVAPRSCGSPGATAISPGPNARTTSGGPRDLPVGFERPPCVRSSPGRGTRKCKRCPQIAKAPRPCR